MGVAFALSLLTLDTVEIHFFQKILDDLKIRKTFFLEYSPKGFRKLEMNRDSLR